MLIVFKVVLIIALLGMVSSLPPTKFNVHQEPKNHQLSRLTRSLDGNVDLMERLLDTNDHLLNEEDLQTIDEEVHILNRVRYPYPTISVRTRSGRIFSVYKC